MVIMVMRPQRLNGREQLFNLYELHYEQIVMDDLHDNPAFRHLNSEHVSVDKKFEYNFPCLMNCHFCVAVEEAESIDCWYCLMAASETDTDIEELRRLMWIEGEVTNDDLYDVEESV